MRPDAPARSPYPCGCSYNPFTLGSVQGIQEGWAVDRSSQHGPGAQAAAGPLPRDRRASRRLRQRCFGLTSEQATRPYHELTGSARATTDGLLPDPGAQGAPLARPGRPRADRPLRRHRRGPGAGPAVAAGVRTCRSGPNGNYLRFAATVWNAGNSPLVVDGFRRAGEDEMDAYQYFFDADGNQTGYQQVGDDALGRRRTHQHWHFDDFARYRLLDGRQDQGGALEEGVVLPGQHRRRRLHGPRRRLEAREHRPEQRLRRPRHLSLREVLSLGLGRHLRAVPRRAVVQPRRACPTAATTSRSSANPVGHLDRVRPPNNVALRKVFISGTPAHRTVSCPRWASSRASEPRSRSTSKDPRHQVPGILQSSDAERARVSPCAW